MAHHHTMYIELITSHC